MGLSGLRAARERGASLSAGAAAALLLAGCGGPSTPDTEPVPAPTPPPACVAPADGPACLDQVAQRLQADTIARADGETVTHAAFAASVDALVPVVQEAVEQSFSFHVVTPDVGDEAERLATTPVSTTWQVGSAVTTLWTCFDGAEVTVGPAPCPLVS